MTERDQRAFSLAAVGRSALILTAAAAAVQLIGLGRELYVAAQVGVAVELDALIIGIVLPTTMAGVFSAGITTALVPSYASAYESQGSLHARRLAGAVLLFAVLAGLALTTLLFMAADPIVALTGPGLDQAGREAAASYLRLVAPTALFASITTVPYAICQAEERFKAMALAIMVGPLASILVMLYAWPQLGLGSIAVGTLVGGALTPALLLAATARYGVLPVPSLGRGLGLRAFVKHGFPLSISALVLRLRDIIDRAISSIVLAGGVGALRYGDSLIRSPIAAIGPAWGGAVYPALVHSTQHAEGSMLGAATDRTVRFTVAAFTPISFLSAAVAPLAVSTVFGRGAFTADDVRTVAMVVAAFAPLIAVRMASGVVTNALNARRAGTTLLVSSIFNLGLNVVLDLLLGFTLGVAGIALSSSIALTSMMLFKANRLSRLEDDFNVKQMLHSFALASAASFPGAVLIGLISWSGWLPTGLLAGLVSLAVMGLAGLALYVILATLIGLREPRQLAGFIASQATRRVRS